MDHSLMIVSCLVGMDVRLCSPKELAPVSALVEKAKELAEKYEARLTMTDNVAAAVKGVDYIHTGVWVSMGEPAEVWDERIQLLKLYQVNKAIMVATLGD